MLVRKPHPGQISAGKPSFDLRAWLAVEIFYLGRPADLKPACRGRQADLTTAPKLIWAILVRRRPCPKYAIMSKMRTNALFLAISLIFEGCPMGTPTPPIPPPGGPCGFCDGVLWPAGSPPEFVELKIWDLEKCDDCPYLPPNGKWWVQQSETDPCLWSLMDSLYYILVKMGVDSSGVTALGPPVAFPWHYFYNYREPCASSFENQWTSCGGGRGSFNGNVDIYWPGP